jgi:hypothetical protein
MYEVCHVKRREDDNGAWYRGSYVKGTMEKKKRWNFVGMDGWVGRRTGRERYH